MKPFRKCASLVFIPCFDILAIRRKLEFVFRINHNIKKFDIENLKNLFLFHGLLYYLSEKRIKIGGHRTDSLSGGPNLTPPP